MKNILRNRTILGIACIVLSLIICFGLTPLFNDVIGTKVNVVRVSENIVKGELITSKKVQTVEVGGYNMSDAVLKNLENIIGKYARADLDKGDYILNTKVSDIPFANYEYLYDFSGNERAISVSIKSFAAGLSGKLEAGDIISIMASDYGELKETVSPEQLLYVQTLAVTASTGLDTEEYQNPNSENIGEDKELPSTITLKVSPEQAKLLSDLEANGKIHIVFVYRGSKENSHKFLEKQADLILEMQKSDKINDERTEAIPIDGTEVGDDINAEE
jgi:pilus assembly protein CpaB